MVHVGIETLVNGTAAGSVAGGLDGEGLASGGLAGGGSGSNAGLISDGVVSVGLAGGSLAASVANAATGAPAYAELSEIDGVRVSAETSRRLCCDAALVRIGHGKKGEILDVGRRTRSIPGAVRRALEARDRGCRFPGCGSRYTAHSHIKHWVEGGETKLTNLLLLCPRHHAAVHEGGVGVAMGIHGKAVFFTPDGSTLAAVPPRAWDPATPKRADGGPGPLPPLDGSPGRNLRSVWRAGAPRHRRDSQIPWEIESKARAAMG